jgi:hypothetical protein
VVLDSVAFKVTKASGKPYDADGMLVLAFHGSLSCLLESKKLGIWGPILPKKIGQGSQHRIDIDAMTVPLHPAGIFPDEECPPPFAWAFSSPADRLQRRGEFDGRRRSLNGLTNRCITMYYH